MIEIKRAKHIPSFMMINHSLFDKSAAKRSNRPLNPNAVVNFAVTVS